MARLTIPDAAPLGEGGESVVYPIDAERVLRVWRMADRAHAERVAEFTSSFVRDAVPFRLPEVLEVIEDGPTLASVERRIPGVTLRSLFKTLDGPDRTRAFSNFARAASLVRDALPPQDAFADAISAEPLCRASWHAYMRDKLASILPKAEANLGLPGIADGLLASIPDVAQARVVHGDYCPENVLMGGDLDVSGVIDFSPHTIFGDPLIDLAGAAVFLDRHGRRTGGNMDDPNPADRSVVADVIGEARGDVLGDVHTYCKWLAVYCAQYDEPDMARWATRLLTSPPPWER